MCFSQVSHVILRQSGSCFSER